MNKSCLKFADDCTNRENSADDTASSRNGKVKFVLVK